MLLNKKYINTGHFIGFLFLCCLLFSPCYSDTLSHAEIIELQDRLLMAGHPAGKVNGVINKNLISSAALYTGNPKTNINDLRSVLGALRKSQIKYIFIAQKELDYLKKNITKLRSELEIEKKTHDSIKAGIEDKFTALNNAFDSRISTGVVSFKYEWFTELALFLLLSFIGLRMYLLRTRDRIIKKIKKDVDNEFNNCRDRLLDETEGHIIIASNKIFSYISYTFWDYYDTQLDDNQKAAHKKDIRYLVHFFAQKALDKLNSLPQIIKDQETSHHTILHQKINLMYYCVDLIDENSISNESDERLRITNLLKEVKSPANALAKRWHSDTLKDHEIKDGVAEALESIVYTKYILLEEDDTTLKLELEKIFETKNNKAWAENIKKLYPRLYS
jgi:hypothetical protein